MIDFLIKIMLHSFFQSKVKVLLYLFIFKLFIYLAACGLSYTMWDLHYVMQDLSMQCTNSLVVGHGLSLL